jgi:hypothetical protein
MTAREFIRANMEELKLMPTHLARARKVVAEIGCTERRAMAIVSQEIARQRLNPVSTVSPVPIKKELSRTDLLNRFDTNTRALGLIREGVLTLTSDDEILPSSKFCSDRCHGTGSLPFKQIAQEPEFQQYQFRVGDQIFWSTPATKVWALQNISRARDV